MATTLVASNPSVVSVAEYMAFLEREATPGDIGSLAASCELFAGLLNDKSLVSDAINAELERMDGEVSVPRLMTVPLGRTNNGFFLRACIWLPKADDLETEVREVFAEHRTPHNHIFSFMTGGYYGPGYETVLYRTPDVPYTGEVGDRVSLELLGVDALPAGKIMLYQKGTDVHSQIDPGSLSISINVAAHLEEDFLRTQFYYEVPGGVITRVRESYGQTTISLAKIAAEVGDAETVELLDFHGRTHPHPTFRVDCLYALVNLNEEQGISATTIGASDSDPFVREQCRALLRDLAR